MRSNRASLTFIFVTILVDVIGVGIIIPVMPNLIRQLSGGSLNEASAWGGGLIIAFSIMQFFFAPVMGELSDRFGRRPILLFSLLGLGIDYIFHALAPTIGWLFVGRILAGITGASYTVATAYIADISTKENKAKNFGLIGAAFGLGFIIGPVIGGVCAKWGVQVPFYVAAGFTLLNFLFGLFFVPESLPVEKRRPIDRNKMIPGVSLAHLGSYSALGGLILAFFLANIAGQALPTTWSYFTTEMYNWTEAEIGYSLGVVGVLVAIVQAGLIGWAVKTFGDKRVIMFGFMFWSLGMTLFAFALTDWMLYAFLLPYVLGGVASPTLQSLISNKVPSTEQGNLQGALTSMISLSAIIGPFISSGLFFMFTHPSNPLYIPGAPYLMGTLLLIGGTILAYRSLKKIDGLKDAES